MRAFISRQNTLQGLVTKVFLWEDIVRSIPYEAKDFVPHKSLDELVRER